MIVVGFINLSISRLCRENSIFSMYPLVFVILQIRINRGYFNKIPDLWVERH